jgi:hypothetical protein
MIEVKAFRTFIRIYSLFKRELLNTNIKLALHKALVRSIMTCGGQPSTEITAPANKVFRIIGNFPRRTPVRDLRMDFRLPYIYDYITKL